MTKTRCYTKQLTSALCALILASTTIIQASTANAKPAWCTDDFPVAPANAQCVNYSSSNFEGGYCRLDLEAYTTDGRAIPSSCAYYFNTPVGVGRPPNPQMVPPQAVPAPPASAAPEPSTEQPFSTADVAGPKIAGTAHLSAVRLARNIGYDRLVFEFTDQVPGYKVGYRPLPVTADPSGLGIPLPGASAALRITLNSATAIGLGPEDERTYTGPSTVTADTSVVTEAKATGDFEAVLSWVVGTRSKASFRVDVLGGPPRLVIDIQH